jgi:hypothetical protein
MNKHRPILNLPHTCILLFLSFCVSSCVSQSESLPRAWIDAPKEGTEITIGDSVTVLSHVYAQDGVDSVVLAVNDEPYSVDSPLVPGSTFTEITQEWIPPSPGEYTLQVTAYNVDGMASSQASVRVRVVDEAVAAQPDLTVTDIQLLAGDVIQCNFKNIGGDVLPSGTDVILAIYVGASQETLVLRAESNVGTGNSLTAGSEHVFQKEPLSPALTWPQLVACRIDSSDNVAESDEDNNELVRKLSAPTTTVPTFTTTPTRTLTPQPTLTVPPSTSTPTQPPDTSPPNLTNINESNDPIAAAPCQPDSVTISVNASDPSGISKVELHYRVVMGSQQGQWRKLTMSSAGGDVYQTTLGAAELGASLSPYGGGTVQYTIKAWDTKNNMTQSGTATVAVQACVE